MTQSTTQNDWVETTLEEVVDVQNGYAFKAKDFSNQGIFVIKIKNIASGKITLKDVGFYDGDISKLTNFFIENGDILVSMTGSHISQKSSAVGKVAIYNVNKKALLNQRVGNIKPKQELIDKKYLSFLLVQPSVQLFWGNKAGGSANQANISPNIIKSYQFSLPPLPEQRAIAAVLSSLDDKIELLREQNKALEEIAQTIFKEWFGKYQAGDELPEGWRVGKLGDIIDFVVDNRGKTPPIFEKRSNTIPLVEVNALVGKSRITNLDQCKKYVDKDTYDNWFRKGHPENGDVLISTVGSVGQISQVFDEKISVAQNIVSLRHNGHGNYLYQLLKSIQKKIISIDISSVQPSIKVPHLLNIEIIQPPEELKIKFGDFIKSFTNKIFDNYSQIQTLSTLCDTLLPKLMKGEVRVKF